MQLGWYVSTRFLGYIKESNDSPEKSVTFHFRKKLIFLMWGVSHPLHDFIISLVPSQTAVTKTKMGFTIRRKEANDWLNVTSYSPTLILSLFERKMVLFCCFNIGHFSKHTWASIPLELWNQITGKFDEQLSQEAGIMYGCSANTPVIDLRLRCSCVHLVVLCLE